MNELLGLILKFDIKGLLIKPSSNTTIQVFRALIVGALAFAADALILWSMHEITGLHYLICAIAGFIAGVPVNFVLTRRYVYDKKALIGKTGEITVFVIGALIGLGLTEVFLWFFTDIVGLFYMISKCIAAVLVFAWNFLSRKYLLYRK